jgi:hypothetical protein
MRKRKVRLIASLTTSFGIATVPASIVLPRLWADGPPPCQTASNVFCPSHPSLTSCGDYNLQGSSACTSGSVMTTVFQDYFTCDGVAAGSVCNLASFKSCYTKGDCMWDDNVYPGVCVGALKTFTTIGDYTYTTVPSDNCTPQ